MNSKHLIIGFMTCCFLWIMPVINCHSVEKPVVAIKEAKVAESVSKSTQKNLNLAKILAEMEASFLATRKFDVVTRNKASLSAIRDEQQFAESDFAAGNTAESGALQNADYLVIPEIHRFAFYAKTHKVPNLQNKYFRRDYGTLEVNAQILDTTTGQIKATFYLKDSFSTPEIMVNGGGGIPHQKHFTDLCKGVSAQMADQFVDLVFPVEIISLKENTVYLNRGQDGGFKNGDVLNVYQKGEELIDPKTGENLGSAEEYIGKIKISRVNPKFTIATILQDKLKGEMNAGCIVRKP